MWLKLADRHGEARFAGCVPPLQIPGPALRAGPGRILRGWAGACAVPTRTEASRKRLPEPSRQTGEPCEPDTSPDEPQRGLKQRATATTALFTHEY